MKSERRKTRLSMLMMAAGATFLAACAMEVDGDEEVWSEQSELTADELTPDESMATEETVSVSDAELAAGAMASAKGSADGDVITPLVSCRRVTASSIPVWSEPSGGFVRCRFFLNDVFSYFGFANGRAITWCPRGVPPSQGVTSFAQVAGTVDGGCG